MQHWLYKNSEVYYHYNYIEWAELAFPVIRLLELAKLNKGYKQS